MLRTASYTLIASSLFLLLCGHLFGQADPGQIGPILPAIGQPQAQPPTSPTTAVAIASGLVAVFTSLSALIGPIIKDWWVDRKDARRERRRLVVVAARTIDLVAWAAAARSLHPDLGQPPTIPADALAELDEEVRPS